MKRCKLISIGLLLTALVMGYGQAGAQADVEPPTVRIILEEDFDQAPLGGLPGGWESLKFHDSPDDPYVASVPQQAGGNGRALYIGRTDGTSNTTGMALYTFEPIRDRLQISFRMWSTGIERNLRLTMGGSDAALGQVHNALAKTALFLVARNGRLDALSDVTTNTWVEAGSYQPGRWHDILIDIDVPAQHFNLFIDGSTVPANPVPIPFHRASADLATIAFGFQAVGNSTAPVYIDDVKLVAGGSSAGAGTPSMAAPTEESAPAPDAAVGEAARASQNHNVQKKWRLTFADEFDGTELDQTKWSYLPDGPWKDGNRSRNEVYLDGEGHLVIDITERNGGYYFGAITTKGKFEQTHGYYEMRAQLPKEEGLWAAFWIMTDGAHDVGNAGRDGTEIDIVESPFAFQDKISHALHWDGYGEHHKSASQLPVVPGVYDGFHTFGLEWNEDEYVFYVDGEETWRTSAGGVSQVPSWVQVSATVGKWAGDIKNANLPARYVVDYVRVYEEDHQIEIASPPALGVVAPDTPVLFEVDEEIDIAELIVVQSGDELYRGTTVPQDLRLSVPVQEDVERHAITIKVRDADNKLWERTRHFQVKRLAITSPADDGVRISGSVELRVASGLGPDEEGVGYEVTLEPVRVLEASEAERIYSGTVLPDGLVIDTLAFEDGAYDLTVVVETSDGRRTADVRRIVIRNWELLKESFPPPTSFFGLVIDGLQTVDRSSNWSFEGDRPQEFWGDTQRLAPAPEGGYLTWQLPSLHRYNVTLYAAGSYLEDALVVEASADGEFWTPLKPNVRLIATAENGWTHHELAGEVGFPADYLRITISGGFTKDDIQLASVELAALIQ